MRKIETQMITAVQNDERWASANTTVIPGWEGTSDVYLHGNKIATIGEDWMQLFDGGRQSKTTKSRLNALLSAFGMDGEYVFQKNFQWFVNYQGSPIPFFDGMRLAWSKLKKSGHQSMPAFTQSFSFSSFSKCKTSTSNIPKIPFSLVI